MLAWVRERRKLAESETVEVDDARARLRATRGTFHVNPELRSLILANQQELLQARDDLNLRERAALAAFTNLSVEQALTVDVKDIDAAWCHRHSVRAANLFRSNLGPKNLLRYGVLEAEQLKGLGCDSLDFVMLPMLASEAAAAYGPDACRAVWLASSNDAVNLAGSEAAQYFEATLTRLLEPCRDLPIAAMEVLRQIPAVGLAVRALPTDVLLNTGIMSCQLAEAGVLLNDLLACHAYTPQALSRLGYRAFTL